jgi:LDH2 family malate/lactate/ureidoglycolate dehydrogenase
MAINPELFMPRADFLARVDRMVDAAKSSELAPGTREVLLPGEIEMRNRAANLAAGSVPLLPSTHRALQAYRGEAGLTAELIEA